MSSKPKIISKNDKELVSQTGIPLHGASQLDPSQFGPLSAPGVRAPRKVPAKKMYQAPRPVTRLEKLFHARKEGVSVQRSPDGLRHMIIVTSNSYKDRERETLTTKSLKEYVDNAWQGDTFVDQQPYYYWHSDDLPPIGRIVWADMEGPFLVEVAKELGTSVSKKAFDYVEAHPEIKWGSSHGFDYPESQKGLDGTYNKIYKFETSLLPLEAAANPYTLASVVGEQKDMDKDKLFDDMIGIPGAARSLRKGLRSADATLQAEGLQHKSLGTQQKAAADSVMEKHAANLGKLSDDPALAQKLMAVIQAHQAEMGATGEEDKDDLGAATPAAPVQTALMAYGDDEEEKAMDDEDTEAEEKAQPGYGEMDDSSPDQVPPLVASAITKQPGTFPKGPVSSQYSTGKSLKAVSDTETILRAIKGISDRLADIEEAMGEVAVMEEKVEQFEANRGKVPMWASMDEATVETDQALLNRAKAIDSTLDAFWGAKVNS